MTIEQLTEAAVEKKPATGQPTPEELANAGFADVTEEKPFGNKRTFRQLVTAEERGASSVSNGIILVTGNERRVFAAVNRSEGTSIQGDQFQIVLRMKDPKGNEALGFEVSDRARDLLTEFIGSHIPG